MQTGLKLLAALALALMIVPAVLFCAGRMEHDAVKKAMLAGTVLWFASVLPMRFRRPDASPG